MSNIRKLAQSVLLAWRNRALAEERPWLWAGAAAALAASGWMNPIVAVAQSHGRYDSPPRLTDPRELFHVEPAAVAPRSLADRSQLGDSDFDRYESNRYIDSRRRSQPASGRYASFGGGCQECQRSPGGRSPAYSNGPATYGSPATYDSHAPSSQRPSYDPSYGRDAGDGYGAFDSGGGEVQGAANFGGCQPTGSMGGWSAPRGDCNAYPNDPCDDCMLYSGWASMSYFGGNTSSTGYASLFAPILQSSNRLLYGDIRGLFNEEQSYQGSFGGGLRSLMGESVILGGYAYYDYLRTQPSNDFQQVVVGVELMTVGWEARSNGYIPTSDGGSGPTGGSGTAIFNGTNFLILGTEQRALSGVDGEFGVLVAADECHTKELRAFVGGYYFNGPNGSSDIPGVSARAELRLYDLSMLGEGSRLEAGVITTYDNVNDTLVTGMVNVRIALGRNTCGRSLSLIERRMLDRVVRRNIVETTDSTSGTEVGTPTINGNPSTGVRVVRVGDDLRNVVQTSPNGTLILVDGGTYSLPNGVALNPNQSLVGGGCDVQVTGSSGRTAIYTVPGGHTVLDRPNTLGPVVTLASNSSLYCITTNGGNNGVFGDGVDNLSICDVTIQNTSETGLHLRDVHGLDLCDTTITGTGNLGSYLENVNDAVIENLTISQTVGSALYYNCGMNVRIDGLHVNAAGATDDAVRFHTQMNSDFLNFDIRNSAHNGMTIGSSTVVTFDQVAMTSITGNGFIATQSGTFTLSRFQFSSVGASGVVIDDTDLVSLSNSTFTNNHNVVEFLNLPNLISGSGNTATGFTTLSTGATAGGSIQFTTPNQTAP